jgi:TonB family protein
MSAAPVMALLETPRRAFPRHPVNVPLDLIVLRSGVPENLPGRCTDISDAGVGAVVAGELVTGQHVAVELRLPDVGVPVRARALVRYQSRLRCGLEFVGMSLEQREMIRYWVYRATSRPLAFKKDDDNDNDNDKDAAPKIETPAMVPLSGIKAMRRIRIGRRGFYLLVASMLVLASLGWWQWQRSWNELEKGGPAGESGLRVPPEKMEKRILAKVEPVYPEAARSAGTEGMVVLDAMIAPNGSVERLRPVSGSDVLVQSATDAVQSWKFEPYLADGRAVEVETTIAVEFRLN